MTLEERISEVNKRIEEACLRSGRSREDVNVIAVTKYVSTSMPRRNGMRLVPAGPGILLDICRPTKSKTWQANSNIYIRWTGFH